MFELIPELNADNADIYFHLIQKGGRVFYYTPVEDPVFAAHRQETVLDMAENVNETVYRPDAPASLIGCATEVCGKCFEELTSPTFC